MSKADGWQQHRAADPDWFTQAEEQMSALFSTLEQINDATCEEAFAALDEALDRAKVMKRHGAP